MARTLTPHGGARREPVLPRTLQQTDHKTGRLGKKRSGLGAVFGWAVQAGGAAAYAPSTMQERADHLFQPYQPPRGVRGAGGSALAMDAALGAYASGQYGMASSFMEQGLAFKGYPTLAAMMLRAEFRKPVEITAREATRAWIRLRCNGAQADAVQTAARLRAIEAELERLHVRDLVRRLVVHALGYGMGHLWIGLKGGATAPQAMPLCLTGHGMAQGQLDRLGLIDPVWTTPGSYNTLNPLAEDYYRPADWWVQGTLVHASRLLTMVPYEVPDLPKPAYNFGGLALPQMLQTYVHNFLRTRQSVSDMISN